MFSDFKIFMFRIVEYIDIFAFLKKSEVLLLPYNYRVSGISFQSYFKRFLEEQNLIQQVGDEI